MKHALLKAARIGTLGLALSTSLFAAQNVYAQDATEPAQTAEEETGFDDWGLLGLFGLAGLAGLMKKQPTAQVHDVNRTTPTRT